MTKFSTFVLILIASITSLGTGYWVGSSRDKTEKLRVPPTRSLTTLPDDFFLPGLAGEVRDVLLKKDLFERIAELATLFDRLGPESLEEVKAAYDSVFLDLGDTELVLFGAWWAGFDPNSAMAWTSYHWTTRRSVPVLQGVMREWGGTDPVSALTAVLGAPSPSEGRRWADNILRGWDESVHDGALEYVERLGRGEDRQWGLYVVTRRKVLRDGPEAALAWAESLPDDDPVLKLNAFRRVAAAAAAVDPAQAAAFAERHLDGPYAKGILRRVGMRWLEHDPEAALLWLSSLPESPNRIDGVIETFRTWRRLDKAASANWIQGREPEPWLDGALSIYAKGLVKTDPREALRLAGQIHDTDLRNATVAVAAREWLVRDEVAGNAWLDQSSLSPEWIAKIRTIPEGIRRGILR